MNLSNKVSNKNKSMMTIRTGILISLISAFAVFTIHKIYITNPSVYAQKVEIIEVRKNLEKETEKNNKLALQNREAVIKIQSNLEWIRESQEYVKGQNLEILKYLKNLKKEKRMSHD